MATTGLYVYGIVPSDAMASAELDTGIDGEQLELISSGKIAAIVHSCSTEPYQGPDSTVERWILEHSQVIEAAWQAASTVLPMSFNVIVSPGDDATDSAECRLAKWLTASNDVLRKRLDLLRDHVELRVEIALDEAVVASMSQELIELQQATEARPAGVQRLYRKRMEERTREVTERTADQLYPEYRRRLAACSEDLVENARPGRTPGSITVLTASLLVHKDKMDAIGVELADIRDNQPGANIRYLGPWPPYSFSEVPELGDEQTKPGGC